jgi:DNA-binding NarL/FixJ family response regulator
MNRVIVILLIEPDSRHADLIREGVARACPPCHLERVAEGEEAKPFLHADPPAGGSSHRPNLSLIILGLPDPDQPEAVDFIGWLRRHPRTKRVPVVVLGAVGDAFSVTRAYDLGASSYLVKPGDESEFVTMMTAAASYWISLNQTPE